MFVQVACNMERASRVPILWQGVRFLPAPNKFLPVIEQWVGMLNQAVGTENWASLMPPEEETEDAGAA